MLRAFSLHASLACAAVLLAGCTTDNSTTGITPITGIVVRSESLTAGHGCGTGDDQVYKYLAVVTPDIGDAGSRDLSSGENVASGIYDCFADATFANLDTTRTSAFRVFVYAFNAKAFAACGEPNLTNTSACTNAPPATDAGTDAAAPADAAADAAADADAAAAADAAADAGPAPPPPLGVALTAAASWTTVCTATQQASIEVLAVCDPLK